MPEAAISQFASTASFALSVGSYFPNLPLGSVMVAS